MDWSSNSSSYLKEGSSVMGDKASLEKIADFISDQKANSATSSDDISVLLGTYEETVVIDSTVVRETVVDDLAVNGEIALDGN